MRQPTCTAVAPHRVARQGLHDSRCSLQSLLRAWPGLERQRTDAAPRSVDCRIELYLESSAAPAAPRPGVSAGLCLGRPGRRTPGQTDRVSRSGQRTRHAGRAAGSRLPHRPIVLVAAATSRARFARRTRSAFRRPLTRHPLVRTWQRRGRWAGVGATTRSLPALDGAVPSLFVVWHRFWVALAEPF